jgi:glycine cleavage system aminomethyltransferase T
MALGYVHHEEGVTSEWCESGQWEIEISEVRHPATWHRRPPYDPENRVLRLVGDD